MGMFGWVRGRGGARTERAIIAALSRSQSVVEFGLDGVVRSVNERFLAALGCRAEAVVGQPHSRFFPVDDAEHLWRALTRGEQVSGTYRVLGASGRDVWFQAVYIPLAGRGGRVSSVLLYACDISDERAAVVTREQRAEVVDRTQGVVEFSLDGMILDANDVFLGVTGYRLDEIVGKHHSIFVDQDESRSDAYIGFWRRLRSGLHEAGLYRRLAKGQVVVWIQATYNPIFDANGRPVKIVKYAAQMTAEALAVAPVTNEVADVLDLIDGASLRAGDLAMDAAIDAAFAEQRGAPR
ncbi:MAG TPA: PAS domain-containing protein [Luteibacter sp.]|uniref:PAS domain-containing protein n=1 Tax=Luteibacter sp. TaxID=1886636 RepID=UPI002C53080E|nr:PAS domain-containing protein [Luteibacter sp.]HVI54446.1 PAS domain-containing protein [Luteibacter sp.]